MVRRGELLPHEPHLVAHVRILDDLAAGQCELEREARYAVILLREIREQPDAGFKHRGDIYEFDGGIRLSERNVARRQRIASGKSRCSLTWMIAV